MAFISPDLLGMPKPLSNEELRRLALAANKNIKRISKEEAEAINKELRKNIEIEKENLKRYEEQIKK